jgi:hypothetical protein
MTLAALLGPAAAQAAGINCQDYVAASTDYFFYCHTADAARTGDIVRPTVKMVPMSPCFSTGA